MVLKRTGLEVLKPVRFVVYGAPNQAVNKALAGFSPTYMKPADLSAGRAPGEIGTMLGSAPPSSIERRPRPSAGLSDSGGMGA